MHVPLVKRVTEDTVPHFQRTPPSRTSTLVCPASPAIVEHGLVGQQTRFGEFGLELMHEVTRTSDIQTSARTCSGVALVLGLLMPVHSMQFQTILRSSDHLRRHMTPSATYERIKQHVGRWVPDIVILPLMMKNGTFSTQNRRA
jgi:hypothetical protein